MHYMKRHKVPGDVQRRVRLWYDYSYSRGRFDGGNDINDITLLPNKMKTELSLHVHLETLRKVTFLQKCQPEFLHDLVLKMKLHIFTPGDYICRKGEIAREMYVISDGILEVVSDTGRILKVLHSGDFFGEIGLLSLSEGQNRRTADVRACGYVELFVLSKDDVLSAIQDYPKAQKVIAKYGRERLLKGSKAQGPRADTSSSSEEEEEKEQQEENIYQPADSEKPRTPQSVESVSESPENPRKYSSSGTFPRIKSPAFLDFEKRRKKSLETRSMRSSADTRLGSTLTVRSPTPRSSFGIQSAMLSFINPVVTPAASVSVETPPLQRKRRTSSQNSSARKVETRDPKDDITTEFIGTPCHFDFRNDEVFADILKASHEETLKNLKSLFRRKMADEYQRMRERIDQLEKQNEDKAREILVLKAKISSIQKPRNVASIDLVDDLSEGNEVMPHIVKVSEISHEKDMAGLDVKTSEDGTKDNISSSSANINSVQADTNAYEPPSLLHIVGTSQRSLRDPFV